MRLIRRLDHWLNHSWGAWNGRVRHCQDCPVYQVDGPYKEVTIHP
jgi:hypothetical protein